MKIWLFAAINQYEKIYRNSLMVVDDVYNLTSRIFEAYQKRVRAITDHRQQFHYASQDQCSQWVPIRFEDYLNSSDYNFLVYEVDINLRKRKLKTEEIIQLVKTDKKSKKFLTKGMLIS